MVCLRKKRLDRNSSIAFSRDRLVERKTGGKKQVGIGIERQIKIHVQGKWKGKRELQKKGGKEETKKESSLQVQSRRVERSRGKISRREEESTMGADF